MTDHPADTPRQGDRLCNRCVSHEEKSRSAAHEISGTAVALCDRCWDVFRAMLRAFVVPGSLSASSADGAARALLADLKEEGCPQAEERTGGGYIDIRSVCVYCGAVFEFHAGEEPRAEHVPMEDGQPCLYLRIMQA